MTKHQINKITSTPGFTLVELIIVITILVILATIAFTSFSKYTVSSRDTTRVATLTNVEKGIRTFGVTTGSYPFPDNPIMIQKSGQTLVQQGTFGENASRLAGISPVPKDPKTGQPYLYSVTQNGKKFQLVSFLEETNPNLDENIKTQPKNFGDSIGMIFEANYAPVSQNIDLLSTQSGSDFLISLTDASTQNVKGYEMVGGIETIASGKEFSQPAICPEGYIPVPGNMEFQQPGFCIAKYEMTYEDANTSNIGNDWNSHQFIEGKKPVSIPGKYPVANLAQSGAIASCNSIGNNYHLVTNNEWMTIARNIESNPINWSNGLVGSGFISNGLSNDPDSGCGGANSKALYPELTYIRSAFTGPGSNTDCNNKRQLTLSNGEKIWDFAGNLWEHVNKGNTVTGSGFDTGKLMFGNRDDWNIVNLGNSNEQYKLHKIGWSGIDENSRKKYGPAGLYNHTQGIGNINGYYVNQSTQSTNVFRRGGIAVDSSPTGIYSLVLHIANGHRTRGVGFRCAYYPN